MENDDTQAESYNYSDASSIARFPTFHFDLHSLTGLGDLEKATGKVSKKINILLAVLEVEGPDTIRIKKGVDAGKEVYLLKMILGDEEGRMCKLTAWRDIAELWGGVGAAVGVKRGDVVLLEGKLYQLRAGLSYCNFSDIMANFARSEGVLSADNTICFAENEAHFYTASKPR